MGWHQLLAAGGTVFALMMLVLVVTSHQWVAVETARQTYWTGVWRICTKLVCASVRAKRVYFEIVRLFLVLSLFCGFFCSSYMLFTYRYLPTSKSNRFLVSAIGCFITGFLMVIATTIYTIFIVKRGISRLARITYEPTFYMAWCTGPIFAVSGFLCLMAHYIVPVRRLSLADQDSLNMASSLEMRIMSMESYHPDTVVSNIGLP